MKNKLKIKTISSAIPADLYKEIKKFADNNERSFSFIIKKSLKEFLERNKK
jgi:predicted transcriptional regulator